MGLHPADLDLLDVADVEGVGREGLSITFLNLAGFSMTIGRRAHITGAKFNY